MEWMKDINILAIETSCDETAAAVVRNGRQILSNVIYSQISIHTEYGGVVPEIASRKHLEKIDGVIRKAMDDAGMAFQDLDAVAVTRGPGLVGALLVGVAEAKALAFALEKPLLGIHHIEGHVAANYLEHADLEPPFACLTVSGGHTHLSIVKDYGEFEIVGRSRDDAAGEAFDKVARAVGLGYPGGPKIDAAAREGKPDAIHFPRGEVDGHPLDFTFSGLKSAVLNYINKSRMTGEEINVPDLCASFQESVAESLVSRAISLCRDRGFRRLAMAGGVAANTHIRQRMMEACGKEGIDFFCPRPLLCTDNAAMIGSAAYYSFIRGQRDGLSLNASPGLMLGSRDIDASS